MLDRYEAENQIDNDGNPTGGRVKGTGLEINWQAGPLGRNGDRSEPTGAFVETVLDAVRQRLEFYQFAKRGRFASRENSMAITKIDEAIMWLHRRTMKRIARKVEGTHIP